MKEEEIDSIIKRALEEDMPEGDITSESIIPSHSQSKAVFLAKEEGVLAGIDVAKRVFQLIDPSTTFDKMREDGQTFHEEETLAQISGPAVSLLKGERIALNFLQRLSGIASATRRYVQAISGTKTKILDTRKTTPGLRILEKYAVRMGGGLNHRLNLSEMVLIKDNHLQIVGSITDAVKKAREKVDKGVKIEVETTTLEEAKEALQSGADMIMLDTGLGLGLVAEDSGGPADQLDQPVSLDTAFADDTDADVEDVLELKDVAEQDAEQLGDDDEVATKLDLARAYVEMGDEDGARSILQEVVAEGNQAQRGDAERLLGQIG